MNCGDCEKRCDHRESPVVLGCNQGIEAKRCENCPEFRGRDKYCACGQWIGKTDMRICQSHPRSDDYTKEKRDAHREAANELHSWRKDWD